MTIIQQFDENNSAAGSLGLNRTRAKCWISPRQPVLSLSLGPLGTHMSKFLQGNALSFSLSDPRRSHDRHLDIADWINRRDPQTVPNPAKLEQHFGGL